MELFFFWWSVISTLLGIAFLVGNVVQFVGSKKEKEIHKSQVKIWQHHANGINHGLYVAVEQGKYSSVTDVQQAVKALQPTAHSLYTSLNEERLFTEQEIKERQLAQEKEREDLLSFLRKQNQATQPPRQ